MAATKQGVTRKSVERLCGTNGLNALSQMLDELILIEHPDGRISYRSDFIVIPSLGDAISQIRHSTYHFDKDLVGTDGASLMHATGSIKPEKIPELKALILESIRSVQALKNAEESEGNIHFFCDLLYSLYQRDEWISEKIIS